MRYLIASFFIATSLLGAEITLQDAWERASDVSSGIKAAQDDERQSKLKKESAKSMYLPSIGLTGSYTHLSDNVKIEDEIDLNNLPIPLGTVPFRLDLTEQDIFLADLHLLWPLYTGGKIDAAQSIYAAQSDETKAMSEMKKDEEFLKLVKYYYGVVVAKALYMTRLESQKALEQHYKNAQKLKENGQIAKIELLNAKVKLDSAKTQSTKAKHKYEIAQSALSHILKQNAAPSSKLFINNFESDEEYYEAQTQQNYAPLKILDAKEKQSQALVDIKKAAWHPEVVAYGNYNLYKDDSVLSQTLPKWFAGVMINIDILKRSDRSQEMQIAQLTNTKVKHLRQEALENLSLLVEKTYKEMLSAKEEFYALSSSMDLSKENYKLRSLSFKEGLSTSVELVDAQMFLLGAKTKRLNAAYEYVQKLSQLCVLSGDREMFFKLMQEGEEIK